MKTFSKTPRAQRTRLRKVIRHFEWVLKTCPETFDLWRWVGGAKNTEGWKANHKAQKPLNCHTTGCFCGHLPLLFPTFARWDDTRLRLGHIYCSGWTMTPVAETCVDFFGGDLRSWRYIIDPEQRDDNSLEYTIVLLKALEHKTR